MNFKLYQKALVCSLLVAASGVLPQTMLAQNTTDGTTVAEFKATGVVSDDFGPVVGAGVRVKGTTNGVFTNTDGEFSLACKPGTPLEVSFIGYKTVEVKAAANLKITLVEDAVNMDEAVVTALGIKRDRKALGYSIDEVKGESLNKAKETNVMNSMAGRVAGLVVQQTAGGPSGSTRVLLRGNTEISGDNQPLYVIDGIPLDNSSMGSAGKEGGYDLGDAISSINPEDIETMSVLKGPAASALYGSRASHGVILITTKKAGKEKFSVEYNGSFTVDTQLARWDNVQETYGMGSNGRYSIDGKSNTNKSWGPKADGLNSITYFDGVTRPFQIIPDNASNFFRTGLTATNSVVLSGNAGNTGLRFTMTDMRNRDIVPNTDMSRDIFNLRTNTTMGKVDLEFGVNYTNEQVNNRPALGDSKSNVGKNLMTLANTYDQEWLSNYQDKNGNYYNWNGNDPYNCNPYWDIYKNSNTSSKNIFRLNARAVYNITSHFKLQGTVGADMTWMNFEDFKAPTTPGYESGYMQKTSFDNKMYNAELLAIYTNNWGDWDFTGTAGANLYHVDNQTTLITAKDMKIREVKSLMSFGETSNEQSSYRKHINSWFAAGNVGWRHMVYLDATVRIDQSSTLPIKNNVYAYPSFSGSWVFSELIENRRILPYGKVRLSWAQVGSDTDPYMLQMNYGKSKFSYPGYTIGYLYNSVLPNPDLKPTRTNSLEAGFELKFLDSRIGLDFTYYRQMSRDQIISLHESGATGFPYRLINAGEIENSGVEITLHTRPIQTKNWTWDVDLNFSKNYNKVHSLDAGVDWLSLESATWCGVEVGAQVGENYGTIKGRDFLRNDQGQVIIDAATGLPKYTDDLRILGNASWDWTGGLSTRLQWKNLWLSAIFDVKVGADLYSMSSRAAYESGKVPETLTGRAEWYASEEARRAAGVTTAQWTPTGGFVAEGVIDNGDGTFSPNTKVINPEDYWMSVCRNAATPFIYDNSYVKCREIILGYDMPREWFNNKIQGMSVSFVSRNPFIVWKNIPNIDPDSNYNTSGLGLEYGSLPSRRSFGLNVNLKF
ncbi:MAG: SusC/RagA family TonB-linked outer membrane protein [Bacteroidaceae bacterium]|nr:SusC/RagA family TonB-linked outer membrane protein [Bacteroidaceae bacterium]